MFAHIPLPGLRVFEAAARLGSFKHAAAELSVTPTAISHQIRALEQRLGFALFERLPRRLRLTEKGTQLFERVHGSLLDIAQTLERLRPAPSAGALTVTTTHSFAALWLVPRLGRFYDAHPDYQLRLDTTARPIDLLQDASIDVAIRYGGQPQAGLRRFASIREWFGVYAAPGTLPCATGAAPTLITVRWRDSTLYEEAWQAWCAAAGESWWTACAPRRVYDEESYALQAAAAGQGLVLASSLMAGESVARGLLVPYRPEVTVAGATYTALCSPGRERHPPVAAFLRWLETQFGMSG
ncbi:LysR substrate-binding domain-containing protein [Bordetella sp. 2513F-2]